jgi:hypothetical protein
MVMSELHLHLQQMVEFKPGGVFIQTGMHILPQKILHGLS